MISSRRTDVAAGPSADNNSAVRFTEDGQLIGIVAVGAAGAQFRQLGN